jgi:hypothetical protein
MTICAIKHTFMGDGYVLGLGSYFVISREAMKSIYVIFSFFIFISCSNPGYSIRINIDKNAKATENEIKLITNCLLKTDYESVMIKEKDFWKVESYKIILTKEKFTKLEHNYINFAVEYYYAQNNTMNETKIVKIEVRIGNSWEGRNPILKTEIDKLADCVVNQLKKRFDDSKILIDRRFTGPV